MSFEISLAAGDLCARYESKFSSNKEYVTLEDTATEEWKHFNDVNETVKQLKDPAAMILDYTNNKINSENSNINTSTATTDININTSSSKSEKAPVGSRTFSVEDITDFTFNSVWNGDLGRTIEYVSGGININVTDKHGMTALHWAAQYGKVDTLNHLLSLEGIDPNITDISGRSPIMLAVMNYRLECVQELLLFGCNTNLRNEEGMTALQKAQSLQYHDIAKCIQYFNKITPWRGSNFDLQNSNRNIDKDGSKRNDKSTAMGKSNNSHSKRK